MSTSPITARTESAVKDRYAAAARQSEAALCCPVDYDKRYLEIIPAEVIEKDYGCGDPSRYVKPGETVLDLGSGTGKICFIAAQVVGAAGKVIGIDMTDDMLEVARRNAPIVASRLGFANVEFRKGRIQDLALDLQKLDEALRGQPIRDLSSFLAADEIAADLRVRAPLVATDSIDVVVSNCVLNLVEARAKRQLFEEIHRVLKPGGRAVISDIVAAREVPSHLQADPTLWSGCISGALTESGFLEAFRAADFYGIEILKRDEEPWRVVEGIEFRSVTVRAYKEPVGMDTGQNHKAIYLGPFKSVVDDHGRQFERGRVQEIGERACQLLSGEPYAQHFAIVEIKGAGSIDLIKISPYVASGPKLAAEKLNSCCSPKECC